MMVSKQRLQDDLRMINRKMLSRGTQTGSYYEYQLNRDGTITNFLAPPVNVQLSNLTPSKHLVEYYQNKILQYDEEDDRIRSKIGEYRKISDQRHKLENEVLRRSGKIKALQVGLDEMQNCLLHERELVLKLYAENDKLKLRIMEDQERILELLAMTGNADLHDKMVYIFNDPPINVRIFERTNVPENGKQTKVKQVATGSTEQLLGPRPRIPQESSTPNSVLKSWVDTLGIQLREQKRLCKEQLETMAESYRIQLEEGKAQAVIDKETIQSLSDRVKKTEELLHLSTLDFLDLKKNVRRKEIRWAAEKDTLIRNLNIAVGNAAETTEVKTLVKEVTDAIKAADELMKASSKLDILGFIAEKEELQNATTKFISEEAEKSGLKKTASGHAKGEMYNEIESRARAYFVEVKLLQEELGGIRKLSKSYRSQCLKLEESISCLREEHDANMRAQQKKNDALIQRLLSTKGQQKRLETYRKLEIEGFKTDVKNLKQKIKEMEKQLLKAVLLFEQGEKDMELLKTVHRTTVRSKRVCDEIKRLKAKLYELETELRNL